MAALTESQDIVSKDKDGGTENEIINTSTVFYGGQLFLGGQTHATATSRGRVAPYTGAAGQIQWGISKPGGNTGPDGFGVDRDGLVGNTGAAPVVAAGSEHDGYYLVNVPVAGVTTVNNSVGRIVYLNDTDNPLIDLTLTRPTRGQPWGVITRYRSGDDCDVRAFSTWEKYICSLGGAGQYTWCLGVIVTETGGAGNLLIGLKAPHHGIITDVYAICASEPVDANMHMDVELEIDGVNLTGGTVTLDFADTIGLLKQGTAVTGNNTMREGSAIDVESLAAGFVAGTAGDGIYNLYAEVQPLGGV